MLDSEEPLLCSGTKHTRLRKGIIPPLSLPQERVLQILAQGTFVPQDLSSEVFKFSLFSVSERSHCKSAPVLLKDPVWVFPFLVQNIPLSASGSPACFVLLFCFCMVYCSQLSQQTNCCTKPQTLCNNSALYLVWETCGTLVPAVMDTVKQTLCNRTTESKKPQPCNSKSNP